MALPSGEYSAAGDMPDNFYSDDMHGIQDQPSSRTLAERLASFLRHQFRADDRTFIEEAGFFFIATADADGRPDCSFKGGLEGLRIVPGRRAAPRAGEGAVTVAGPRFRRQR